MTLFAALPANTLLACGHDKAAAGKEEVVSEKTCCKEKPLADAAHCAEEANSCGQNHPGQKCPDHKGCCGKGCACPCGVLSGSHSGILFTELSLVLPPTSDATIRGAFYFARHMPEGAYLAIWQPPQLCA